MQLLLKHFFTRLSLLGITMLFLVSACTKESAPPASSDPPVPADTSHPFKTYLALGDSYTIGASVGMEERFPVQTTALLYAGGVQMTQAEIKAASGWTTGDLLSSIISNPPARTSYDLVSLLIGVNNQYQGKSQEEYRAQFTMLLNKAIVYAGGRKSRVFVLSIPDYSVTPFAQHADTVRISNEIDAFNAINREISHQMGVRYIYITDISREGRTDPAMNTADGLHPSGKQYQRWSVLLAPQMKASL